MDCKKQILQGTDSGVFNAIKSSYGNRNGYSRASSISTNSSTKTGYETNDQQLKFIPIIEVAVVDPNQLYSSDSDDSEEDSVDAKANSNETEGSAEESTSEAAQVEPTDIELLNDSGLFDFDVLNISPDVILPKSDFFADCNDNFDLGSYVIEEKTALVLPSVIQKTPVKNSDGSGNDENKDVVSVKKPIAAQNTDTDWYRTTGLNLWKRKNEIRNYAESCSESDDDTLARKPKKRKVDNDPSYNAAGDRKARPKKNVARRTDTAKVKTSQASYLDSSRADKQNVCTVNGLRFSVGRGKKKLKKKMRNNNTVTERIIYT